MHAPSYLTILRIKVRVVKNDTAGEDPRDYYLYPDVHDKYLCPLFALAVFLRAFIV
jgi:hypothetical protein